MVEVSEIGLKEEEVELDLGLSIGGSFRKSEKQREPASKSNGFELHLEEHQHQHQALPGLRDEKPESMAVIDLQTKREIHALRRQEAKKKREEKQHKRVTGTCRGRAGDCVGESEPEHQRVSKRGKTDHHDGGSECPNVNLNLSNGEQGLSCTAVGSTASFPTAPVQHPHPYAYVPLNNGFAYPCVLPWLAPCGKEKNVAQPAGACNGFRPFSANGYASEQNGERDCGDKKPKSNGSSMCSSSAVSDYQSSSHEGGGSSDSHSHSVQSLAEPTQLNSSKEINIRSQPEQTASSHPLRSENGNVESTNDQTKLKEEPTIDNSKAVPRDKPLCNTNSANGPLKETKIKDIGKPPKPLLPQTSSHAQMPCVSTTGNGPNGKTVYGFLYRYTNSEVSIVCVCHGSTFSPAEFVHHAGGTDISHPLRHITVSQVNCRRI